MPRGGRRAGVPGKAYGNRTDLNLNKAVPTGRPYGERKATEQSLRAVPLPDREELPPLPAFDRPSERPDEPLTAGMDIGPGPGSSVLPPAPEDLDTQAFAKHLPTLELIANLPGTSVTTRNLIRRLKGGVPVQPPVQEFTD